MRLQFVLVPHQGGGSPVRRHRFMESSDFNAAAAAVFDIANRVVRRGRDIAPVFFGLEMDPATPGLDMGFRAISPAAPELEHLMAEYLLIEGSGLPSHEVQAGIVAAGARHLLSAEGGSYSIVGHLRRAQTWSSGASANRRLVDCVVARLFSVDRSVEAIFRYATDGRQGPRLSFALPEFTTKVP